MRTSVPFATLLGLTFAACTVGDTGGTGDDNPPVNCGNNQMDTGEQCDDGNTDSGDGCSASCQTEAVPRLDVSVDKTSLSTELLSQNMVTVTLTGSGGFAGTVTLTASAVDSTGAPLAGWTVSLDKTSVDVPMNGTGTAVATLAIPSDSAIATGMLKVTATSGTLSAVSAVSNATVAKQLTFTMKLDANGQCVYPAAAVGTVKVAQGTKIRFLNGSTAGNIRIHMNNGIAGLTHQDNDMGPNAAYEVTVGSAAGTSPDWYCHTPGNNPNNMNLQAVP